MKQVDTFEYVSMLKGLVEEGHEVSMIISGSSMAPFLCHGRDTIYFKAPDRPLKVGDIVFYQRPTGQYVVHRICGIREDGFSIIGDNQQVIEYPVRREHIFGLVTKVVRKGRTIRPGDFWWEFFARVWLRLIPLRPMICKIYSIFAEK